MTDMLRLAGGVIAILGIGVLLFNEQLGLSEGESQAIAGVAVVALAIILGYRYMNYRQRKQEASVGDQ